MRVGFDVRAPDSVGEVDLDCGIRGLRQKVSVVIQEINSKFLTVTLNMIALDDV